MLIVRPWVWAHTMRVCVHTQLLHSLVQNNKAWTWWLCSLWLIRRKSMHFPLLKMKVHLRSCIKVLFPEDTNSLQQSQLKAHPWGLEMWAPGFCYRWWWGFCILLGVHWIKDFGVMCLLFFCALVYYLNIRHHIWRCIREKARGALLETDGHRTWSSGSLLSCVMH